MQYQDLAASASYHQAYQPWGNSQHELGQRAGIVMPIRKAIGGGPSKGYTLLGVGSDERRDMQQEIVKVAMATAEVLTYLIKCGVMDWDHIQNENIGKVLDASLMSAAIASARGYDDIVPPALEIKGRVNPLPHTKELIKAGMMNVHGLIEQEHPLFYSVYGNGIKIGPVTNAAGEVGTGVVPTVLNRCAVTAEPMNHSAGCRVAKSMNQFWQELLAPGENLRNGAARTLNELPPLVFVSPQSTWGPAQYMSEAEFSKSLTMTGASPVAGTTGGDSLKVENGGQGMPLDQRRCVHCMHPVARGAKHCSDCGAELAKGGAGMDACAPASGRLAKSAYNHLDVIRGGPVDLAPVLHKILTPSIDANFFADLERRLG